MRTSGVGSYGPTGASSVRVVQTLGLRSQGRYASRTRPPRTAQVTVRHALATDHKPNAGARPSASERGAVGFPASLSAQECSAAGPGACFHHPHAPKQAIPMATTRSGPKRSSVRRRRGSKSSRDNWPCLMRRDLMSTNPAPSTRRPGGLGPCARRDGTARPAGRGRSRRASGLGSGQAGCAPCRGESGSGSITRPCRMSTPVDAGGGDPCRGRGGWPGARRSRAR